MRVEPVAETKGTRLSLAISFPISPSPITSPETPSGTPLAAKTSWVMCWQAIAVSGVFSDGFQTQTSPQTHAKAVFQFQTATGKLKAEIIPTMPSG